MRRQAIRRTHRPRRHVRPAALTFARVLGFRYDPARDAYLLRLVGNRWGPVLKARPPVGATSEPMEWSEEMEQAARPERSGRFTREPEGEAQAEQGSREDVLRR